MARIKESSAQSDVRGISVVQPEAEVAGGTPVPGAASLMGETWYVVNKAAQHLREGVEAALLPLGLRRRHYAAMTVLLKGELSQQELSDRIPVDRATMVAIIDDLEKLGLAERRQHPDDRRAYKVALQPAGEALVNEAARRISTAEARRLSNLSPTEQRRIADLSRKLLGWDGGV